MEIVDGIKFGFGVIVSVISFGVVAALLDKTIEKTKKKLSSR